MELLKEPVKTRSRRHSAEVCPSLLLHQSALCDVGEKPYLPSAFQVQEFCTTGQYRRCPLRFAARLSLCDCTAAAE